MLRLLQVVVVTDPGLARGLLRSKLLDKFRYQYSYLDPVSAPVYRSSLCCSSLHRATFTLPSFQV